MSPLRMLYLGLAVWGALHPSFYAARWFSDGQVLPEGWANSDATQVLLWNVSIAAIALLVFALAETMVRKNWVALLAVPATLCIGPSCGLPLYLFLRTRPVT